MDGFLGRRRHKRPKRKRGEGPRVGGPFAPNSTGTDTDVITNGEPTKVESLQMSEPRVIVIFGSPLSGVTEALQILHEVSRTSTNLVCGTDWIDEAEKSRDSGCPVTLVDAPVSLAEAQDAYDRRLVCPGSGALVRLWSSPEEILRRAREKGRNEVTKENLDKWTQNIQGLENYVIHTLQLPYFMVPNEFGRLTNTIAELAQRAGISN